MIRSVMAVVAACVAMTGISTIAASGSSPASHPHRAPRAIAVTYPAKLPWSRRQVRRSFQRTVRLHRLAVQRSRREHASRAENRQVLDSSSWAHSPAAIRVANCESGGGESWTSYQGEPHVVASSGHYGKWQFSLSTWFSVGGHGSPAVASVPEQDYRAWRLWQRDGWSPWQCAGIVGVSG